MTSIEVSGDEDALIGLLRGESGVIFHMGISNMGGIWSVTMTTDDGVGGGNGSTFREAFLAAHGFRERAAAPAPSLRIVGGTEARKA